MCPIFPTKMDIFKDISPTRGGRERCFSVLGRHFIVATPVVRRRRSARGAGEVETLRRDTLSLCCDAPVCAAVLFGSERLKSHSLSTFVDKTTHNRG